MTFTDDHQKIMMAILGLDSEREWRDWLMLAAEELTDAEKASIAIDQINAAVEEALEDAPNVNEALEQALDVVMGGQLSDKAPREWGRFELLSALQAVGLLL